MLSQVERGETSPTLAVAARIAAGLELSLSQLLRLDEAGHVAIVRARPRAAGAARGGHAVEELTPPLPGQRADVSRHALDPGAATGGPGDPPLHEPGSRETAVVLDGDADAGRSTASATSCAPATASPSTPTCRTTSRTTATSRPSSLAVVAAGLRRS